jgi:DNA-binding XRE family transcriptional regulator
MTVTGPGMRNDQLRRVRRKRMLTIEEAAKLVGVDPVTFSRWELGIQKPRQMSLRDLCDTFRMTAEELGFGDLL